MIDDYLLTNRYLDTASLAKGPANPLASIPPEAMRALTSADPNYIAAAFAVIDRHPGGAAGWLHDELGLSHGDLIRLRNLYLLRV